MRGNLDTIFGLNWLWRIQHPMDFLKCRNLRWKEPEKRNKPNVVATTAKHPDLRSQISRYGWMQPTYMRSVTFWGKFTSGSRISASRSDLLKLPIVPNLQRSKNRCRKVRFHELSDLFLLYNVERIIFPDHLLDMRHFHSHFKGLWAIQNFTEISFIFFYNYYNYYYYYYYFQPNYFTTSHKSTD